ncbi:hypothetical protein GGF46_004123 [Coemansia sp. RSA 552]|nr:hypothetical protein GGF46_004123 [Coemansia sp. RSA 552]
MSSARPAAGSAGDGSDSDVAFPSFSTAPVPGASAHAPSSRSDKERRHRKRRHHGSDSECRSRRREKRRHERSEKYQEVVPPPRPEPVSPWRQLLESGSVAVDTYGDPNLRQFQQSTRSAAPRFTRRGGRAVLGLGRRLWVDSVGKDNTEIQLSEATSTIARYMDIDWKSHEYKTEDAYLRMMPDDSQLPMGISPDYVPIGSATTQGDRLSDGSEGGELFEAQSAIRAKTAELEARTKASVHDVDAWLQLVAHQDAVTALAFSGKSRRRMKRAIAEVKADIFRRALHSNRDSRPLALGYLAQCADILDDDALLVEWQTMVESTSDPQLILHYVRFCQTLASRFSVPWVADVYAGSIRRVLRCGVRSVDRSPEIGTAAVELIHCVCLFFREAGYAERALATYQAALEWYIMTPATKSGEPASHRMHAFKRFWSAGQPRVGMDSATGWCSYGHELDSAGGQAIWPDGAEDPGCTSVDGWCAAEVRRSKGGMEPWVVPINRLDEENIQAMDPHALVLFEDIEPFLVDLPPSQPIARLLLDRFLQFLGVVGPRTFVLSPSHARQQLVADELMWMLPGEGDDMYAPVDTLSLWPTSKGKGTDWSLPGFPFISVPVTLDTLDMPLGYANVCPWLVPANKAYRKIARNTLVQTRESELLDTPAKTLLSVVLLEWQFVESPADGGRAGKDLLAENPTCLSLWNTLAKMHARTGAWSEARRVWTSAILLADTLPQAERPWVAVLCKSWAVLEAFYGRGLTACVEILAAVRDPPRLKRLSADDPVDRSLAISATDLTNAQGLVDGYARAYSPTDCPDQSEVGLAILTLRLWLAYAARPDGQAVEKAYEQYAGSVPNERAELSVCAIHLFHAQTSRVFRAADLRARVQRALRRHPHNTVLWQVLLFSEQRAQVGSRFGHQLAAVLAENRDHALPDLRLFGVYSVLCRGNQSAGINRVRWALDRATRNGASSSLLAWMVYIVFECRLGTAKRAKQVLLTALRMCPWAKPLYMLALGTGSLASQFADHEKQALLRSAVSAGLRTRVDLAGV